MFHSSARALFPHPRIIVGWERVRTWNGWSKRSGREDGRNLEVGQDQIGNQVYTTVERFYNPGNAGIPPGCRYRSGWLERIYAVLKSRPAASFYCHFFRGERGDKGRSVGNRSRDSLETVISPFINFYGLPTRASSRFSPDVSATVALRFSMACDLITEMALITVVMRGGRRDAERSVPASGLARPGVCHNTPG